MRTLWMQQLAACVLCLAVAGSAQAAEGKTKSFPKFSCRVSLPGEEWEWVDPKLVPQLAPRAVCAAMNKNEGLVFYLVAMKTPKNDRLNDQIIAEYERGFLKPGFLAKRGGRQMTFKGVPCYQYDVAFKDSGDTATIRLFIAHGWAYQMQLAGGTDPVEDRADFESIFRIVRIHESSLTGATPTPARGFPWRRFQRTDGQGSLLLPPRRRDSLLHAEAKLQEARGLGPEAAARTRRFG